MTGRRKTGARRALAVLLALGGVGMALAAAGPEAAAAAVLPQREVPLLERMLLGESALLARWADGLAAEAAPPQAEPVPAEDAAEEPQLTAVTPADIREKTITGTALFNRTQKAVDLAAVAAAGTPLRFAPAADGPQILIVHTHGTESFARDGTEPYTETGTAHTTDAGYSVIRLGDEIARIFGEMGLSVLHDTTLYDYPAYDGAYDRARAGIEAVLAEHPTVQMVLDVHRDALVGADGTVYKPVLEVDGVKTAQVMLLVGTDDAGAYFPDWTEHLALAMQLQRQMDALWPDLARPITLRTARFNQQLTKGSLLVEIGSHGNTLDEALAGARLFARATGQVLCGLVAEG